MLGSMILLAGGLFHTQVIRGSEYAQMSERNYVRLIPLEAPRGRVLDVKGRLLADNRPSFDVVAIPEDMRPETFSKLAPLLKMTPLEVRKRLAEKREYLFAPAVIAEDISKDLAYKIEEYRPELPGVSIRVSGIRYYPYQEVGSHLIGYIGKISQKEYETFERSRFGMTSMIGRAGLEKNFDSDLRGYRGGRTIQVNASGHLVKVLSERNPESGKDLHLTVDLEFQKKIMGLIKDKRATVAVMDLSTDGLLALATSPAYDPNVFVSPMKNAERMKLIKEKKSPLLDRATSSAYPPGSVFKLVTALAGLETGVIQPGSRFYCSGQFLATSKARPMKCWWHTGHGSINLYESLERSCNVYFYNIARKVGVEKLAYYARMLGYGSSFDLETGSVNPGLIPDPEWKKEKLKEKWYEGETLNVGIGQGFVQANPLQVLKATAFIAKEGEWVEPHLIQRVQDPAARKPRLAAKKEHFRALKKGMFQVVHSPYGTGQLTKVEFAKMAAKTGTAQDPPREPHSWMTGFLPYKDPKIAFVVFVENGGSGGITAGKILKEVLLAAKEAQLV